MQSFPCPSLVQFQRALQKVSNLKEEIMTADLLPDNLDDAAYWTEPESETSPSAARRTLHHGGQEADESETEERITKAPTAKRRAMRPKLTADLYVSGPVWNL